MPLGLDRSGDFRHGNPVTLPHNFGNAVTEPKNFGNVEPQADATKNSNPVTWTPSPTHFGNPVTLP